MARALREISATPVFGNHNNLTISANLCGIGAAGAVDATNALHDLRSGVTVTLSGTGVYNIVYPACVKVRIVPFIQKSAAATITEAICTAVSATAGTATLRFSKAGTATAPANGDVIGFVILGSPTGVEV